VSARDRLALQPSSFIEWPHDAREHTEQQVEGEHDVQKAGGTITAGLEPDHEYDWHDRRSGHCPRSETAGTLTVGLRSKSSCCKDQTRAPEPKANRHQHHRQADRDSFAAAVVVACQ
jgi:hypothetical protein